VDLQPTPIQTELHTRLQEQGRAIVWAATDDDWVTDEQAEEAKDSTVVRKSVSGRTSVLKAAALSALLPGLGQVYNDRGVKARYFFGAEAISWAAWGAFRLYGGWKEDDFISFGNTYANAQLDGKSKEFQDWVGFYDDIDDFNAAGRVGDPERPYLEDSPDNHWHWASNEDRQTYRNLKNASREAYRRSDFMLWVMTLNRVVAVIDAVVDARRSGEGEVEEWEFGGVKYDLDVNPFSSTRQFTLTVYPGF
jgi:hypothetical protein